MIRGNCAATRLGHPPDGGAGSSNFQFAAPVLSLDGRGQDLNFGVSLQLARLA